MALPSHVYPGGYTSLSDWCKNTTARYVWDDPSVAKAREDCTPFTFSFHPTNDVKDAALQEKVSKKIGAQVARDAKKATKVAKAAARAAKAAS